MSKHVTYTAELRVVNNQIKNLNKQLRLLRVRKKTLENNLLKYMNKHELQKIDEFEYNKLKPKEKKILKPKVSEKQRKSTTVEIFKQIGVINPDKLYDEIKNATTI